MCQGTRTLSPGSAHMQGPSCLQAVSPLNASSQGPPSAARRFPVQGLARQDVPHGDTSPETPGHGGTDLGGCWGPPVPLLTDFSPGTPHFPQHPPALPQRQKPLSVTPCSSSPPRHPCPRPRPALPVFPHLSVSPQRRPAPHTLRVPPALTAPQNFLLREPHPSPRSLSAPPTLHGPVGATLPSLSPCPSMSPQRPSSTSVPYPSLLPPAPPSLSAPLTGGTALRPLPAVPPLTAGRGAPCRAGPGGGREAPEAADGPHRRRHLRRGRMRERPPGPCPCPYPPCPYPPRPRSPSAPPARFSALTAPPPPSPPLPAVSRVSSIRAERQRSAGEAGEGL